MMPQGVNAKLNVQVIGDESIVNTLIKYKIPSKYGIPASSPSLLGGDNVAFGISDRVNTITPLKACMYARIYACVCVCVCVYVSVKFMYLYVYVR